MNWTSYEDGKYFPLTRAGHSSTMLNANEIVIFSGYDNSNNLVNDTFLLDIRTIQ